MAKIKIVKISLLFFTIVFTLLAFIVPYQIMFRTYMGPRKEFIINRGDTFGRINFNLKKERIIDSTSVFYHYAKSMGSLNKFKTGRYIINSGTNMISLLNTLTSGKGIVSEIVIPEGKNLYQIAEILHSRKIVDKESFIAMAFNKEILKTLNIKGKSIEGYLFPDTYHFQKSSPVKVVINTMVKNFFNRITKLDITHPKLSFHQIITLASIVEKETGAAHERPIIAGVFHNRLKKRMRLQSDPTTIYGLYPNFSGNLTRKNLLQKTPYNTYKISGLPIGPIANPGLDAIKSVLSPAKHKYLYFVSKNDGTHYFSKSYKEHQVKVQQYQISRKYRDGRSWRDLKTK